MNTVIGPERLKNEVMASGLCAGCGACVGLCPYIYATEEKVAMVHSCGLENGNCHRVCPRLDLDPAEMDLLTFNSPRSDHILGEYKGIYFARSTNSAISEQGQYGGVVSALACFLLENKKADAAVLAKSNGNNVPDPVLAHTPEEVLQCAGSKYSACPTLSKVSAGLKAGCKSLCVIGRPCQVGALRKVQHLLGQNQFKCFPSGDFESFVIGLFCFWSLTPDFYKMLQEKTGVDETVRFDIPPNKGMVASLKSGAEVEVPLDEIRQYIRKACQDCFDPTSEYADVSVGSTEHDMQWNTLIVRTEKGEALIKEAQMAGVIEIKEYPSDLLPNLLTAVANKKSRVINNLEQSQYLKITEDYINRFNNERAVLMESRK